MHSHPTTEKLEHDTMFNLGLVSETGMLHTLSVSAATRAASWVTTRARPRCERRGWSRVWARCGWWRWRRGCTTAPPSPLAATSTPGAATARASSGWAGRPGTLSSGRQEMTRLECYCLVQPCTGGESGGNPAGRPDLWWQPHRGGEQVTSSVPLPGQQQGEQERGGVRLGEQQPRSAGAGRHHGPGLARPGGHTAQPAGGPGRAGGRTGAHHRSH